jgi:hypothetical protein
MIEGKPGKGNKVVVACRASLLVFENLPLPLFAKEGDPSLCKGRLGGIFFSRKRGRGKP